MEKKIKEIIKAIMEIPQGATVAVFPHIGVDGDCLGSTLALKSALCEFGLSVHIFTNEPVPEKFSFFPGIHEIKVYSPVTGPEACISSAYHSDKLDCGILVDCSQTGRIGECAALYDAASVKMVVDHHFTSLCGEQYCYIDSNACAAGELVYKLISALEKETGRTLLLQDAATSIMAAIMSDTGGYRYSNTNVNAFGISHDLFSRFRINTGEIAYQLFEKSSLSRIRLQGLAYGAMRVYSRGRIVICPISKTMIEECGAEETDVNGICANLKTIEGVEAAFVLREKNSGEIRVNIRSSEKFSACDFAAMYNGGGHAKAAGFTLSDITLENAFHTIVESSTRFLEETEGRIYRES